MTTSYLVATRLPKDLKSPGSEADGLQGAELAAWLDQNVILPLTRRWDREVSRYNRLDALTELTLGASEFLPKASGAAGRVLAPKNRQLPIPQGAYAVSARHALERAVCLDTFGTKKMRRNHRDSLISDFAEISHFRVLAEIAIREDECPQTSPGHLGLLRTHGSRAGLGIIYQPGRFDFIEYVRKAPQVFMDYDVRDLEILQRVAHVLDARAGSVDPQFDELSEALKASTGYTLLELFTAFRALRDNLDDHEVVIFPKNDFLSAFSKMAAEVGMNLFPALESLMFSKDRITVTELDPRALRFQGPRLRSQPVVESGEYVLVARDLLFETLLFYSTCLQAADWPLAKKYRAAHLPAFDEALTQAKQRRGARFEEHIANNLTEAGIVHSTLKRGVRCGGATMRREVDHVAIDESSRILWVLEDKDLINEGTLLSIRSTLDEFLKPKGYLAKLLMSVDDISGDPGAVAAHVMRLNGRKPVRPSGGPWTVRAAFVIRDLGPIAYVTDLPVDVLPAQGIAPHILSACDPTHPSGPATGD